MIKVVYIKLCLNIFKLVIFNICIVLAALSTEAKGDIRLSYRVAETVCASTVKFVQTNQIQRPSEFPFVNEGDLPCKTLTWNKCGRPSTQSACQKFKLQECSVPARQQQTKPKSRKQRNNGTLKIVNGTEAVPNEFSYIIRIAEYEGDFTFCGGTIFNENYIITAAHCVYLNPGEQNYPYYVMAGDHEQHHTEGPEQQRNVTREILHEDYNRTTHEHDIALLQVDKPFQFSDIVYPPNFPDSNYDAAGQMGVAAGWGSIASNVHGSNVLLKVLLSIISYDECKKMYLSEILDYPFRDVAVCAIYPGGGIGTCQGDSGGPLVVKLKNDCDVLVGITSTGRGCADPKFPTVFTHVANHMEWIRANAV